MKLLRFGMIGCLVAAGLAGCSAMDDVAFARRVMTQLIEGRYAARTSIDWPRLTVMEQKLGPDYVSLPNDKERADYERAFIDGFRKGYQGRNATVRSFVNWRLFNDADPSMAYVAADTKAGTNAMIFFVSKDKGQRKFVGMRVVEVKDRAKFKKYEEDYRHVLLK